MSSVLSTVMSSSWAAAEPLLAAAVTAAHARLKVTVCERSMRGFIKADYLIKAKSIPDLGRLEINRSVLEKTIQEFNRDAVAGSDRKFHRGDSS